MEERYIGKKILSKNYEIRFSAVFENFKCFSGNLSCSFNFRVFKNFYNVYDYFIITDAFSLFLFITREFPLALQMKKVQYLFFNGLMSAT